MILYILLCGLPPFWASTDNGIFDKVRKGSTTSRATRGTKSARAQRAVVRSILVKKPSQRATIDDILNHPWVRENGDAPDGPLDNVVMTRMKKFSAMNKFKKMGLLAMARTLTQEEISGMKEMFKSFDKDGSGTITIDELQRGLQKKGAKTTSQEMKELLKSMDVDGSGEVDYEEFAAATLAVNKLKNEDPTSSARSPTSTRTTAASSPSTSS